MPLSEEEQRILQEIEANLTATDPGLVQQVSETTLYRHAARAIKWAVVGFVAGLVLLLFTFTQVLFLGVVGFLVMLACLLVIERNVRKLGKAGMQNLTGSLRGGSLGGLLGSTSRRWRERWHRDENSSTAPALAYSARQAARLTGCTEAQLSYWERIGLVAPQGGDYSFRDLVALRVVASLLEAGLAAAGCARPCATSWRPARTSPGCGS